MTSLREIKSRKESVDNTAVITKAMQLVSASKMVRAQMRSKAAQPYADALMEMITKIDPASDPDNPFFQKRPLRKVGIFIIGPSRGFVGGLSVNLMLEIDRLRVRLQKENPDVEIEAITMHKVGLKISNAIDIPSKYHFAEFVDNPTTANLTAIKEIIINGFMDKEFDEVYIAFTQFRSTSIQNPSIKKLLPIEFAESNVQEAPKSKKKYIFEPDRVKLLGLLIPEYIENQMFSALLDSIASEHSARMIAMKQATDNANELSEKLTLFYNQTRQAQITQELIEIISAT